MAWRGCEEQAFADGKIFVVEAKAKLRPSRPAVLVRFIEHGKIKPPRPAASPRQRLTRIGRWRKSFSRRQRARPENSARSRGSVET